MQPPYDQYNTVLKNMQEIFIHIIIKGKGGKKKAIRYNRIAFSACFLIPYFAASAMICAISPTFFIDETCFIENFTPNSSSTAAMS